MSISKTFARPAATLTNTESTALVATLTEGATTWTLDIRETIGGNSKLIKRLVITPGYTGVNLQLAFEYTFAGDVANYVSSTSPANSLAASSTAITVVDMDAFHTAAGDARS